MFLRSDSREPHETSRRRWAVLALLACLVAAGVLRLTGLDYALPEFGGHDERVFLEQTEFFRSGKQPAAGDEWVLTAYPHLLPRLGALLPSPGSGAAPAATLDEALVRAAAPWTQLRTLLALLSLASVPLTWLLARRWMSALGACVAAGLVATSLLHITLSIQQKPHAVAAGLDLLALLAALELVRKPSPLRCLLAGAAAALAIGSLHSAALCLPPLCAALLLVPRRALPGAARRLAAALVPVAASVALFYPFFLSTVQASSGGSPRGAGLAGFFGFVAGNLRGARWARLATSLVEIDPVLCVLALAGLLLFAWQCSRARRFGELLPRDPGSA